MSSLYKNKSALYYFQISLFVSDIFKFLKYTNGTKKDIATNLYQMSDCLRLDLSSAALLPWQHTGFQTTPILKALLATFGVPFCCLLMGASYALSSKHINMLA